MKISKMTHNQKHFLLRVATGREVLTPRMVAIELLDLRDAGLTKSIVSSAGLLVQWRLTPTGRRVVRSLKVRKFLRRCWRAFACRLPWYSVGPASY